MSAPNSPYLAFIVGLHVATAAALLVFFWRDWVRIVTGFFTSLRHRRIETPDERLAWLIVAGYTSINAVVKAELFPTRVRATGVGVPYAVTVSIFGGTAARTATGTLSCAPALVAARSSTSAPSAGALICEPRIGAGGVSHAWSVGRGEGNGVGLGRDVRRREGPPHERTGQHRYRTRRVRRGSGRECLTN